MIYCLKIGTQKELPINYGTKIIKTYIMKTKIKRINKIPIAL